MGGAECCGSAGVCGGPLCKLIDNLRGSDKIPARVHGRAISARPCQHNLVRSGGLEKKFTPPFFLFGRLCFSRSIKGQTHTQTHAGPSLGPQLHILVSISGGAGPAELGNSSTSFLFPVTMVTVKKNYTIIRRIGQQKLFLSPLPHLSACYNRGDWASSRFPHCSWSEQPFQRK